MATKVKPKKTKKSIYKTIAEQYKDWLSRYPTAGRDRRTKHFDRLADKELDKQENEL